MASFESTSAATPSRHKQPTKSYAWYGDLDDSDSDLDSSQRFNGSDTIPCSPHITQPTQIIGKPTAAHTTQPTQILGANNTRFTQPTKPGAVAKIPSATAARSSPPAPTSDIEVPASSPFQGKSSPTPRGRSKELGFGSKIAPAGTAFRRPELHHLRSPPVKMVKRPAPEPILLSSDDEDEISADIQRTDFSRQVAQYAHTPEGANAPSRQTAAAPNAFGMMMNRGSTKVAHAKKPDNENVDSPVTVAAPRRRLVQGSQRPTPSTVSAESPPPPPRRRNRLQQGLPPRSSPVSSQGQHRRTASSPDPLLSNGPIVIASSDGEGDGFEADSESEPDQGEEGEAKSDIKSRVLKCLNEGPLEDIKAMSKRDVADLKLFISKRPFNSIAQARAVNARKPGSKKAARVQIGDAIVDEIDGFLRATQAIDGVVAECEAKAKLAKREMDIWNVDMCGLKRGSPPTSDDDRPLTPRSLKEYRNPPIPKQPAYMEGHCQMKEFQRFGLNWMNMCYKNRVGCILADEMGLGKTCQVISFMCHLVESGRRKGEVNWPNLIVVPPSTYDNWLAEFEKFTGNSLNVIGYQGSQAARVEIGEEILEAPEDYHVILTTYTQVVGRDDREFLRSLKPVAAVFDEGHKMKNPDTKIYGALRRVNADWRLLLTGTPVQNNLSEMIALLSFINPKLFGEGADEYLKTMFSSKVSARDVGNSAFLYSERVRRARTILEPFILRRVKQQVIEMPGKVRNIVYCDLPDNQRPIYDEYEAVFRRDPARAPKPKGGRGNDQNNVWVQLRKAALHPQLFRRFFDDAKVEKMAKILMANVSQRELQQESLAHLTNELKNLSDFELHLWCRDYGYCIGKFDLPEDACLDSGKVTKLLELIAEYQKNGDRVLVFSKFAKVLDILAEVLATSGIQHRVLSGQTNVQERQTLIDEFSEDTGIPVFLLTTAAGGTGINLTAANKVVIFDQSDNPQDDIQAENRAHRLGQTREVEIIRLIARNTVEELIYKACDKKIQLANKVTGADDDEGLLSEQTLETEVRNMMSKQQTPP